MEPNEADLCVVRVFCSRIFRTTFYVGAGAGGSLSTCDIAFDLEKFDGFAFTPHSLVRCFFGRDFWLKKIFFSRILISSIENR